MNDKVTRLKPFQVVLFRPRAARACCIFHTRPDMLPLSGTGLGRHAQLLSNDSGRVALWQLPAYQHRWPPHPCVSHSRCGHHGTMECLSTVSAAWPAPCNAWHYMATPLLCRLVQSQDLVRASDSNSLPSVLCHLVEQCICSCRRGRRRGVCVQHLIWQGTLVQLGVKQDRTTQHPFVSRTLHENFDDVAILCRWSTNWQRIPGRMSGRWWRTKHMASCTRAASTSQSRFSAANRCNAML
jgi:hypothetical protein